MSEVGLFTSKMVSNKLKLSETELRARLRAPMEGAGRRGGASRGSSPHPSLSLRCLQGLRPKVGLGSGAIGNEKWNDPCFINHPTGGFQ